MLTFDALSPRFALLGLGPSWMLMDGVFCQLATFDRTQPEGLALATYLGAVSALANTVVVPAHAAAQRKLAAAVAERDVADARRRDASGDASVQPRVAGPRGVP